MGFRTAAVVLSLGLLTLAVFSPVLHAQFLNFDDNIYVYENQRVLEGLGWGNLRWALTAREAANWHPLTWLSHMLDVELFGLEAWGHHLTSLLLHLLNTLLLFLVLRGYTGAFWRSAFAAALFAVHPLHVESVAWVAERKDVLSAALWLATMGAWLAYVRRPSARRYLPALLCFAAGLMAKPMLVTLPFALLLLDAWPLGRLRPAGPGRAWALVREKLPFFALSAASAAVTYLIQLESGAVVASALTPPGQRLANAVVSLGRYLARTVYPARLNYFYFYPDAPWPVWQWGGTAALLAAATCLAARRRPGRPYLLVGWLWYVGTLVPVLGIIRVGMQAMADRYTYLPLIGVFIILSWGLAELAARWRARGAVAAAAAAAVAVLAVLAQVQTGYWHDNRTLFGRGLEINPRDYLAWNGLGIALAAQGRVEEAGERFAGATRINPGFAPAHYNLGLALQRRGDTAGAIGEFRRAVALDAAHGDARNNLGSLLLRRGDEREAVAQLLEARRLMPGDPVPPCNLGAAALRRGDYREAEKWYREALRKQPGFAAAASGLRQATVRRASGDAR